MKSILKTAVVLGAIGAALYTFCQKYRGVEVMVDLIPQDECDDNFDDIDAEEETEKAEVKEEKAESVTSEKPVEEAKAE